MRIVTSIALLYLLILPQYLEASDRQLQNPFYVLKERFRFDDDAIRDFRSGEVITRQLESDAEAELIVVGGVYLEVPAQFLKNNGRNIIQTNRTSAVSEIGLFDADPSIKDLDELSIVKSDIKAADECEVHDCDLKLPEEMIKKFKEISDRSDSGFTSEVSNIFKSMLIDILKGYQEKGYEAMLDFDDQDYSISTSREYQDILKSSDLINDYDPEIIDYLLKYPDYQIKGVQDYFFWVKQNFENLRPITMINHTCIFEPDSTRPAILTKSLIYASHYYEGSLETSIIIPNESDPGNPGCFLLYVKRSRFDTLRRGGFLGIIKGKLKSGVEDEVGNFLNKTKRKVEELYIQHNNQK